MLKKISWIVALFAALTMAFIGCTNLGLLDDGTAPVAPEDLVVYGADLEYTVIGNASQTSVSKNLISFKDAGTSTGFSFKIPDGAENYTKLVVYFDVVSMDKGKPGLLIKKNNRMENLPGIINDQDPRYQFCDVTGENGEKPYNFAVGKEWNTGEWEINRFDGVVAFQHQHYVPPNNTATYTLKLIKVVFPGVADATVNFDVDGGKAVSSIVVQQGKEIGALPVTTKAGAAFAGWYTTTATTIQTADGTVVRPVGTEVLSDYVVAFEKTLTLRAKWVTTGVQTTAKSIIHAYPALSDPDSGITLNGSSATIATGTSWAAAKYVYPTEVTSANGSGTLADPYTYKYNVVELTVTASEDCDIQVKDQAKGSDINKYPSGDQVVSLKKGVNTKFSVALSDSGWGGLSIQNKGNANSDAGNKDGTVVTLVSAVFTEGTMYKVSFDRSVPVRNTDVPTQTIISGRKATKPADPVFTLDNGTVIDFEGWYLDGKLYDFGAAVTANIDIVSKFGKVTQRIVRFDLNGGKLADSSTTVDPESYVTVGDTNPTFPVGDLPTIATLPTGVDSFGGWYDMSVSPPEAYVGGETLTKDLTLTARYITTFDVTLAVNNDNASSAFPNKVTGTLASGTLTLNYVVGPNDGDGNPTALGNQIAFIPLTTTQIDSVKEAISITIEVTVDGTPPSGSFRYGLANKTLGGSWNGTAVSWVTLTTGLNTLSPAFANLSSGKPGPVNQFFIQRQNGPTTADTLGISKIKISLIM